MASIEWDGTNPVQEPIKDAAAGAGYSRGALAEIYAKCYVTSSSRLLIQTAYMQAHVPKGSLADIVAQVLNLLGQRKDGYIEQQVQFQSQHSRHHDGMVDDASILWIHRLVRTHPQ